MQKAEYKGELWDDRRNVHGSTEAIDDRVKDLVRYYNSLGPKSQHQKMSPKVDITNSEIQTEVKRT